LAIPTFVGIFAAVMWGRLLDKRGHSLKLTLVSCVALVFTYLWFLALSMEWIMVSPIAIMIFFGFGMNRSYHTLIEESALSDGSGWVLLSKCTQ
jgi:MFS family permease